MAVLMLSVAHLRSPFVAGLESLSLLPSTVHRASSNSAVMAVSWWAHSRVMLNLLFFLKSLNEARAFTKVPGSSLFSSLMPWSRSRATESPWSTGEGDFPPEMRVAGARPGEGLASGGMRPGFGRIGPRKQVVKKRQGVDAGEWSVYWGKESSNGTHNRL